MSRKSFFMLALSIALLFLGPGGYSGAAAQSASTDKNTVERIRNGRLQGYPKMTIAEAFEPHFTNIAWKASGKHTAIFSGLIKESYYSRVANSVAFRDAPEAVHKAVIEAHMPIFAAKAASEYDVQDFFETWKNESDPLIIARDMLNYYASRYYSRGTPVTATFTETASGALVAADIICPTAPRQEASAFLNMLYYPLDYEKNIVNP